MTIWQCFGNNKIIPYFILYLSLSLSMCVSPPLTHNIFLGLLLFIYFIFFATSTTKGTTECNRNFTDKRMAFYLNSCKLNRQKSWKRGEKMCQEKRKRKKYMKMCFFLWTHLISWKIQQNFHICQLNCISSKNIFTVNSKQVPMRCFNMANQQTIFMKRQIVKFFLPTSHTHTRLLLFAVTPWKSYIYY